MARVVIGRVLVTLAVFALIPLIGWGLGSAIHSRALFQIITVYGLIGAAVLLPAWVLQALEGEHPQPPRGTVTPLPQTRRPDDGIDQIAA